MGLERRVEEPVKVVSMFDDAIDWSETPRLDYAETRRPELIAALPGREADLVWFTVAPLEPTLASWIRTQPSPHRELEAFQWGVTATSQDIGLEWRREKGRPVVRKKSMSVLLDSYIEEIGGVVLKLGDLTSGEDSRFGR